VRNVRTESFKADNRTLDPADQQRFREAVRLFSTACDRFVADQDPSVWPGSLRIKPVQGAAGVWEMTWSFSGPDGRATWQWTTVVDETGKHPAILWRRIGDHRSFKRP